MATVTPAAQLAACLGGYTPEIARSFKAARRKMRAFVPRGYELVYETYNALGIGYGAGEGASDVIVSIVGYPRWITLFFLYGAHLDDPNSLLEGKGSRVRSIRLQSADDLDRPGVRVLIAQALAPHTEALERCSRLRLVIKSIASQRRAGRPARPTPARASTKTRKGVAANDA